MREEEVEERKVTFRVLVFHTVSLLYLFLCLFCIFFCVSFSVSLLYLLLCLFQCVFCCVSSVSFTVSLLLCLFQCVSSVSFHCVSFSVSLLYLFYLFCCVCSISLSASLLNFSPFHHVSICRHMMKNFKKGFLITYLTEMADNNFQGKDRILAKRKRLSPCKLKLSSANTQ